MARTCSRSLGHGVVLAALGALGAASLCGIDIEEERRIGALLLRQLGHGNNAHLHHGDMWCPWRVAAST